MPGGRRTRAWAMLLALGTIGCAGAGPRAGGGSDSRSDGERDAPRGYPTPLLSPSQLGADFAMQQKVTMKHPRGQDTLRAVLQKRGDELTLVGLAPHGGRAFVLRHEGSDISFDSYMPRSLPFPPRYMLHDVQRTWFLSTAHRDWLREHGELIEERTESGRIVERRFERLDGQPSGEIVVRYGEGLHPDSPGRAPPPGRVTFDNGWFGYKGTIETLSWQPLSAAAASSRTAAGRSR